MVEHKDVVVALLGVSAGLAGLVLVFLGLIVTSFQTFPSDTAPGVLRPYRRSALLVLAAFGIGVVCVGLATAWLVDRHDNECLYRLTIVVFAAQVVALTASTGWAVRQILWAG